MKYRRAFITWTALFLIAIAAIAMASITSLLTADVQRTMHISADTQLRQLLLAGALDASGHLSAAADDWSTPVPASLTLAKVQTHRTPTPDGADLTITATLADRNASQRLHVSRSGDTWRIASAELANN